MVVPTIDTVRYSAIAETLLLIRKPVFFTGVTGTGKTIIMQSLLDRLRAPPEENGQNVQPAFITFSAKTDSNVVQSTIESKLEKKRKNLLGAPVNKVVAIFVDDVNMPEVEEYGAQPPIELLRQFVDFQGFYDRKKWFWKAVENTVLFCAAAPPGGGRSEVTPRFVRHFNVLCLPPANVKVMHLIFSSILHGFLTNFKQEVRNLVDSLVRSTLDIYQRISAELLPTPSKSHYTFNLRDVSKVFQGILMIQPRYCSSDTSMIRLWIHESMRQFHDRLVSDQDKMWFTNLIVDLLSKYFKLSTTHDELFGGSPILFGDYFQPGADKVYQECQNLTKVQKLLDDYCEEYSLNSSTPMNLVFFEACIEHVTRITRILRQPRGNAMLVGVGGSGRQSATKLACFMAEYDFFQIELTRGYGLNDFREDLRSLFQKTGVQGKSTVFLFNDTQIVQEGFLEDINNILNTGEVPNLFPPEDLEGVSPLPPIFFLVISLILESKG